MAEMADYVPFSHEGAEFHRNRVRLQALNDRPHLLKIPFVIEDCDGKLMLTQSEAARSPSENSGLALPSFRPNQLSRSIRYARLVRERIRSHIFREFDITAPMNSVRPYGVYKDYSSDTNDEPTAITQLPAYIDLGVPHEDMEIFPNYFAKRGEVVWCLPEDALEELRSERSVLPDNMSVKDSIALIEPMVSLQARTMLHRFI